MAITKDLAALLARQMESGAGSARITFGSKDSAFAWCGDRLNATIAYVNTGVADNTSFNATLVNNTADVEAWTTGEKTNTATITSVPVELSTFPGVVEVTTKQIMNSAGLGSAISLALYGQALRALDAALITDLLGAAPGVDGAATLDTIAQAQATLMGDGFNPGLVVVSPTLYASLAAGSLLVGGNDPQQAQQGILGARLLVSSALSGAAAVVLDPQSVTAVEHAESPVVLMETHARLNKMDIVVEVMGGWLVTQPMGVVSVWDSTP